MNSPAILLVSIFDAFIVRTLTGFDFTNSMFQLTVRGKELAPPALSRTTS